MVALLVDPQIWPQATNVREVSAQEGSLFTYGASTRTASRAASISSAVTAP